MTLFTLLVSVQQAGAVTPIGPCIGPTWRGTYTRPPYIGTVTSISRPLAVHWNRPEDEEKATVVLESAELAWAVQVDEIGFNPPALPDHGDGPELDIFLADIPPGTAFVQPDRWPWEDIIEGDGHMGTPAVMVIDQNITEAWLPSYVAHEFNHVLQFATDFTEPTYPIWEGVATAAQWWTIGDPDWDYDVYTFQEVPAAPTLLADSYALYYGLGVGGATFEYGAALWVMHLDQIRGDDDGRLGAALWRLASQEGRVNEPDVLEGVTGASGQDLGTFLNGVARSRWLVGPWWDERGLPDARDWTLYWEGVPFDRLDLADLPVIHPFEPVSPMVTGQAFVHLDATGGDGELTASVASETGLDSALIALWWHEDGSVGEQAATGANPTVVVTLAGMRDVVLATTNLGAPDFDGDDDPYRSGDQLLTLTVRPPPTKETDTGATDTGPAQADSSATSAEDTAATTPGTTDGTDELIPSDTATGLAPDPSKASGGCGCATSSPAAGGASLVLLSLVRRRRQGKTVIRTASASRACPSST